VSLFAGSSDPTLQDIRKRLIAKQYERGAYIVKIGDQAKEMFFVADGTVEYMDSKYHTFSHSNSGDFFGELALLYSIPRTANVRAATDVTLYVLSKKDFDDIRSQNEVISKAVEAIAQKRFNHFKYELVKLAFMPHDVTFSDEQVNSFREAFYRYTQNTGKIDKNGLKRMVFDLSGTEFNEQELKSFFNTLDVDKDGVISFDDFLAKIRTLKWILDPKDNEKYSAKIMKELEREEDKKPFLPNFDGVSFGLGSLVGAVAIGAIAFAMGKMKM
jgi:CRP-like cAMP-binding protein